MSSSRSLDLSVATDTIRKVAVSVGYSKLKPEQEKAILSFVFGNDVFVSLPTVSDALRGVEKKSIVLVALMKEHVVHFSSMGKSAAYVSDKYDPTVRQSIKNGEVQLVFLSPQSFLTLLTTSTRTCSWLARRGRERWPAKQADPEVRATRMHAQ